VTGDLSIQQAALAAGRADWQARAEREAAAILAEFGSGYVPTFSAGYVQAFSRDTLVSLLGIAWLQGAILGSHETLASAEQAFERLRESLW
jgi:hypothetical protein